MGKLWSLLEVVVEGAEVGEGRGVLLLEGDGRVQVPGVQGWRGGEVERWRGGGMERWRGGELESWRSTDLHLLVVGEPVVLALHPRPVDQSLRICSQA